MRAKLNKIKEKDIKLSRIKDLQPSKVLNSEKTNLKNITNPVTMNKIIIKKEKYQNISDKLFKAKIWLILT